MPSTVIQLTHSNTSIYGALSPDVLYGDTIGIGAGKVVIGFTGTELKLYFQHDYPGSGKGLGVSVDGGAEALVQQAGANYLTATTICTGLSEGTHTVVLNLDYNSAGAGSCKLQPASHSLVTGSAPALSYASGYGRAYHTGNNSNSADVYRLGPRLSQSESGVALPSMNGGYNGGGQIAFKSDASSFRVFVSAPGGGATRLTLFDVDGEIVTSATISGSFSPVETTLSTGLAAGTTREYVLGFNVAPTSIVAVGGTLSTGGSKPAARQVFTVCGTSITVTAAEPSHTPEDAGSQVGLILGGFSDNLGVGGSPLIGGSGTNVTGQERLDEIIAQNPRSIILEHLCNDTANAATFAAALEDFIIDCFAGCSNLERFYWVPLWTTYTGDPAKASDASAWRTAGASAVAAANVILSSEKAFYVNSTTWNDNTTMWDGVHPDRPGARYAAEQVAAGIQLTLDNTAPSIVSAETNVGGVKVTITFDGAMGSGTSGFTLKINGTSTSVLSTAWQSETELVIISSRGMTSSDTITLAYAPGTVEDAAGNALASITSRSVDNNSTVSGGGGGDVPGGGRTRLGFGL